MKTRMKARFALRALGGESASPEMLEKFSTSEEEIARFAGRLRKWAYRAFQPPMLEAVVAALAAPTGGRGLHIVQIGANDGVTGDPVHELILAYAGRALLVEPQTMLIDRLRANYAEFAGELHIVNQAIGSEGDYLVLHTLRDDLHEIYQQRVGRHPSAIASFDADYVKAKVRERLDLDESAADSAILATSVPASRLDALLAERGFDRVDLLQVDCEGYDWKVLETLGDIRPAIINFESFNLSRTDWAAWVDWANANGYGFIQGHMDCLAIKNYQRKSSY